MVIIHLFLKSCHFNLEIEVSIMQSAQPWVLCGVG